VDVEIALKQCNTTKQAKEAVDFVRYLYRRGILSQTELEGRLSAWSCSKPGSWRRPLTLRHNSGSAADFPAKNPEPEKGDIA